MYQKKKQKRELRPTARKILLLLAGGMTLGLSRSPRHYFKVVRVIGKEWEAINRQTLYRNIRNLYQSKLISFQEDGDGFVTLVLSDKGKEKVLKYKLDEMKLQKKGIWDGQWRFVFFDIPEKLKKIRDAFRFHLKKLGFYEFQKSVFVVPVPCYNEIEFLIEFYNLRPHVRFLETSKVDNELHLKKIFKLIR